MNNIDINQVEFGELQKIAEDMFKKFVFEKSDLNQEEFEKEIHRYARKILNANLRKDGITGARINIKDINNKLHPTTNGGMSFRERENGKETSVLAINFDKIINGTIAKNKRVTRGLSSNNPKIRMQTITSFFETMQHEYRHYKQDRAIILDDDRVGYTLKEKYVMAKEKACRFLDDKFFYKFKRNYEKQYKEADARLSGKTEALTICKNAYLLTKQKIINGELQNISIEDVDEDIFKRAVSRETNDIVMSNEISFFKATGNREKMTDNATTLAISCNKKILKLVPILGVEFDENGRKRTVDEIIKIEKSELKCEKDPEFRKQIEECMDMIYTQKFFYEMNDKDFKETVKRLGKEKTVEILNRCNRYNENTLIKNKQDLYSVQQDSKCIINGSSFVTNTRYNNCIKELEDEMYDKYIDNNKRLNTRINTLNHVKGIYKSKKEREKSLNKSINENKKFKFAVRILKDPIITLYNISEAFDTNKKNERGKSASKMIKSKNVYNYEEDEIDYDGEVPNLDEKKKEYIEKEDIKKQKIALLDEAKECYRESEKYEKYLKNKNIEKSR